MHRAKGKSLMGKVIISEETGRKFGVVGDISFVAESGELMNIILSQPTAHIREIPIKEEEPGKLLIPFSAVKSVGDFVIVSERDIL